MDEMYKQFTDECKRLGHKDATEVREFVGKFLNERYKGKVSQGRIDMFIDDITESVCLALGFPDE